MNRAESLLILFALSGAWMSGQSNSGWKTDPEHRQLKYRVQCSKGSSTVDWANGYRKEVNVRATLRSAIYEGPKQLTIAPGGTAKLHLETLDCAPIHVRVTNFSVAGARPPVVARRPVVLPAGTHKSAKRAKVVSAGIRSKSRRKRRRPNVTAPAKAPKKSDPEITSDALASARVGMTPEQIVARFGAPAAQITMPDENQVVQIFSYRTAQDKMGAIYFSNGKVSEVRAPR